MDDHLDEAAMAALILALRKAWTRTMAKSLGLVALQVDVDAVTLASTPAVQGMLKEAAQRIVDIEGVTRKRAAGYVARAAEEGMSIGELAKLFREDPSGAFSRSRATTIARTETGECYNGTSLAGYAASGRVTHVDVRDNEGPNSCEECKLANGQTWTLAEANKRRLEHPNCVRSWNPVVRPVVTDFGDGVVVSP